MKPTPKQPAARYSDGHPLDEVHYLESKIILKGDRFTSVDSFTDFAKVVRRAADDVDIGFSRKGFKDALPKIREVLFLDTADFRLYNNAFILRRRLSYEHGFAAGAPEFVFKFRHPDLQKCAEIDVRPKVRGDYEIKFKAEALPLKDQLGGMRLLYSHNVEFALSRDRNTESTSMANLMRIFPPLMSLRGSRRQTVELVNHTAVEEVLLDIGRLNFGKGIKAKANVAVWRTRGDEKPLVGEFAFQCKFQRDDERHAVAMKRCERFFLALQDAAKDWLALGTTKTGAVYRLKGNPPQAHE
ncbi:MAG TPA: hypothetical protein VKV41_23130 [Methylomirabilota bacterium]|jgi:hypothetical protein|nr:hypothetical protein [Methylomirabilota bacterium]